MRPNLQETADLVTFTEEICNGKRHFLCILAKNVVYLFALNKLIKLMKAMFVFQMTVHVVCHK